MDSALGLFRQRGLKVFLPSPCRTSMAHATLLSSRNCGTRLSGCPNALPICLTVFYYRIDILAPSYSLMSLFCLLSVTLRPPIPAFFTFCICPFVNVQYLDSYESTGTVVIPWNFNNIYLCIVRR